MRGKYEAIPEDKRNTTHTALLNVQLYMHTKDIKHLVLLLHVSLSPRLITKMTDIIARLEDSHNKVNDVYASGAVEGYGKECLAEKGCEGSIYRLLGNFTCLA